MTEHNNLYFRVKKHLRANGIRDHSKFRTALNNRGEQVIDETPAPAPSSLNPLNHSELFIEYEDIKTHKCDIYTSFQPVSSPPRGALVNTTLTAVTMLPVRRTHVTTEGEAGAISLQPGMYKFTVIGKRFGNLPFYI